MNQCKLFTLLLCFNSVSVYSQLSSPLTSELSRMNTLTMRSITPPSKEQQLTHIHHLVMAICQNGVPPHTLLRINEEHYSVQRNIEIKPNDNIVFIFSRGYAKSTEPGTNEDFIQRGACAKAAYIQMKDQIIPPQFPLISFDYDDGRYGFAFGQQQEIQQLETVYSAVLSINPQAHIILIGDCRGAKVALELATRHPKNLKALILMAPFISARDITSNIAKHHLGYLPLSETILHRFFKFYFKNYDEKQDDLLKRLVRIDQNLPIFIAHRKNDQLVSTATIYQLINVLQKTGNKRIHYLITHDQTEPHSKLTGVAEIREAIQSFLQTYTSQNTV